MTRKKIFLFIFIYIEKKKYDFFQNDPYGHIGAIKLAVLTNIMQWRSHNGPEMKGTFIASHPFAAIPVGDTYAL